MRPRRWASFLAVGAALAGLAMAGAWSIRAGWADYRMRQETVSATEAAIALTPGQSEYYARLAWLVSNHDPQTAKKALGRAVALNPWDARSWIELGLRAEAEGDGAASVECLLRAARADNTFLPRWTLANYYFRHDDPAKFWFWAQQAAAMVYGDAQPLFLLCGKVEEDGKLIDRLQIRAPEVQAGYLSYLLGKNRIELIGPAVQRLVEANREADLPLLMTACERLLETGRIHEAAEVWNQEAAAGRVGFRTPAGEGGQLAANGDFAVPPSSRGFDWRLPAVEGVSVSREENARGLRVTFSGREPEDCEVLAQWVPVREKMQYELGFTYRTRGIATGQGLGWRITDANRGTALGEGAGVASEEDAEGRLTFATPAECRLVRLALRYHRSPGTTRMEGFLILRSAAVRPAQLPIDGSRVRK
jgi:tetratricopeptide (TPR) repeat protein